MAEDSFNVLSSFLGDSSQEPVRSSLVVHSPNGNYAIRRGSWKFVEGKANPDQKRIARRDELHPQLYDLAKDPGEQSNLIDAHPEIVDQLSELLRSQRLSGATRTDRVVAAKPWQTLFNGKDLTGWEANFHPESFTVEDGILKAHGKHGMSHLFYTGDQAHDFPFKDFEMVVVARSEPNSNSGIFFHTDRELRKGKYLNKGYEVQLNSSTKEKRKNGQPLRHRRS